MESKCCWVSLTQHVEEWHSLASKILTTVEHKTRKYPTFFLHLSFILFLIKQIQISKCSLDYHNIIRRLLLHAQCMGHPGIQDISIYKNSALLCSKISDLFNSLFFFHHKSWISFCYLAKSWIPSVYISPTLWSCFSKLQTS